MNPLKAYRQIHLDFHTSEALTGVAEAFDPQHFVDRLSAAHVDSVTLFARCHHGWLYYDSKRFPERVHPHLKRRNLLLEQMEACRAAGIRTPVYITVQFDHLLARQHPEWLVVDADGSLSGPGPFEASFYRFLAVNTGYGDHLRDLVADLFESVEGIEGVFFDIVMPQDCCHPVTLAAMQEAGLDPEDREQRKAFGVQVINDFKRSMTEHVRSFCKDCGVVYNAGHVGPRHREVREAYSHFEVESLGSGQWGYAHFPTVSRYVRTLGLPFLGMTGKFHTEWGDFHSFKPRAALEYEVNRILAAGGGCSIGDQLHPSGRLCEETYRLIGEIYAGVKDKEPWCRGAKPMADVAVFNLEASGFPPPDEQESSELTLDGSQSACTRLLMELGMQFDLVDGAADWSAYAVLILPDRVALTPDLVSKVSEFVTAGGAVLATFASGLTPDGTGFAGDLWPVRKTGDGPLDQEGQPAAGRVYEYNDFADYILPNSRIGAGLPPVEHVMVAQGFEVEPVENAEILLETRTSSFDRRWNHFCSHRQTPSSGKPGPPAVVQKGKILYFRHPLFWISHHQSPVWIKEIFRDALNLLLPRPLVSHDGPSTLEVSVHRQENPDRYVVHLLHEIPVRKAAGLEIVEDRYSSGPFTLRLHLPESLHAIREVPSGGDMQNWRESEPDGEGRVQVEWPLDGVQGHRMFELIPVGSGSEAI